MDVNHAQMPGYLLLLFLSFSFSLVSLINIDGRVFLVHHVLGGCIFVFKLKGKNKFQNQRYPLSENMLYSVHGFP